MLLVEHGALARLDGASVGSKVQNSASRLQRGMHNLLHSNKHVDVLKLMLGCSRLVGQLPRGLSVWPVPRTHTPARRRESRARHCALAVCPSHWARCRGAMVGRLRAGRGVGASATRARCVGGGVGRSSPSMAFVHSSAAGRIVRWLVLVFGAKGLSASSIRVAGAGRSRWCGCSVESNDRRGLPARLRRHSSRSGPFGARARPRGPAFFGRAAG